MIQKLKPFLVVKKLKEKELITFTTLEFRRLFDVSPNTASCFIRNYTQKGLFTKLRNSLYILTESVPNYYLIANRLYQPSYISFDTALSYHQMIPETIYSITSATPKISREFTVQGVAYVYHKIKQKGYTGYMPIRYLEQVVFMAEPEKALADYLYFIGLGRRQFFYERLDIQNINKRQLWFYLKLFKRPSLLELAQKIYDQLKKTPRIY